MEGYTGTSWTLIEKLTKISTSGTTKTYNNVSAFSKFRFSFTKGPGQIAFDDVSISCGSGSSFAMDPFEPATEDQRSELWIYPNPGTGLYTIEGSGFEDGTGKIYVFDLLGRNILTKEISVEANSLNTSIDISNFKNGVYSIRIELGSQTEVKRIIKK
ncbi:T9SS type A sorting domain-containing protein [candidate division KSB1 bacterium]